MTDLDLIVLGSGAAGQSVAHPCRAAGWSVAVVDSRPFGGTCALRGCDPKKVLVGVSELADWGRRMQGRGLGGPVPAIAWPDLVAFERSFVEGVPAATEASLREAGITPIRGRARFLDPTTVAVGDDRLSARHIVVAAGARHAPLGIPGEEYLTTSTEFLRLSVLPSRVAFVGGGYIAFEFAHVAARAGARVQILHRGRRPLPAFDADLVDQLVQSTRALDIEVRVETTVTSVERRNECFVVTVSAGDGLQEIEADLVVHAAGRVPEIDDLDLPAGKVERRPGGVTVSDHLQSVSNPAVYAAGDAVDSGGLPLTPVAGMQGGIVATNLLQGNSRVPDYAGIPSVVFTTPPLARVGLDEAAAAERRLHFTTHHDDTSGWYTSRRVGLKHTGYKTLVEEGTERILGAHLLGVHAEEMINVFGMAIRFGLTASQLKEMVYAYPTSSSDIGYMLR